MTLLKVAEPVFTRVRWDEDEHRRTHCGAWGVQVHDKQGRHNPALTELRRRVCSGLATLGLNKRQLAARAALGRTTVSEAFQADWPVPSAVTVAALARALKLPVDQLLELQRTAAAASESGMQDGAAPGMPIGEWEPHDLEVHPAGNAPSVDDSGPPARRVLPGYVRREHDRVLAEAVQDVATGHSRMVVLAGTSSTGKTRACWEAVQPLAPSGWRLWHPFDPTRAEAALSDLHRVRPRTVVWLNEAQHYLGNPAEGERIAAALHTLLVRPERGPVLVLGTLWPEYAELYTALPTPGGPDPHSRVRELLAGRTIRVPEAFDEQALAEAALLANAGDWLLSDALTRAHTDGRLPQDLAGAPALLDRYEQGSPAARAVLQAAMDARRLGVGLHLPQVFLTDAATDYFSDIDYDQRTEDWAEQAFAELARPVHGKQAPLRRSIPKSERHSPSSLSSSGRPYTTVGPVFRLSDYLEQHGRITRRQRCPPASFWHAAHAYLNHPDDLVRLSRAAQFRHRLQWAHHLAHRAADACGTDAVSADVLVRLGNMRNAAGDQEGAQARYRQAAEAGHTDAMVYLASMREETGDRAGAEALYRRAAKAGHAEALAYLAGMRDSGGDREGAETLYLQAATQGSIIALLNLTHAREVAKDTDGADTLALHAARASAPSPWSTSPTCGKRPGIKKAPKSSPGRPPTTATASPCSS
ncbi:hypothetical protein ACFWN5_21735 [Streptomyces sp. NPDC058430]|uniref:hypothetical protein n=1 Tax=Streptomyces sp. NPDC058430 TaxID=3346495 RepID=UPI003648EBC4